jgi:hypothetical protein
MFPSNPRRGKTDAGVSIRESGLSSPEQGVDFALLRSAIEMRIESIVP